MFLDYIQRLLSPSRHGRYPFHFGAPSEARTRDPLLKRQVLLPTELQAQIFFVRFIHRFSFHHFSPFLTFYKYYIKIFIKNQFYSFYLVKLIFWCPRRDLNPYVLTNTWFWVKRVCQFHHSGKSIEWRTRTFGCPFKAGRSAIVLIRLQIVR